MLSGALELAVILGDAPREGRALRRGERRIVESRLEMRDLRDQDTARPRRAARRARVEGREIGDLGYENARANRFALGLASRPPARPKEGPDPEERHDEDAP